MVRFVNEGGNRELKNRKFKLPDGIRKHLIRTLETYNGDKTVDGYKRLNNILGMGSIAYNEMKRIKNFFDGYNGDGKTIDYILNGGEPMRTWVDNTLNTATATIRDFKQAKKDAGFKNAFISPHEKDRQSRKDKPSTPRIDTKDVSADILNDNPLKYESKRTVIISEEQAMSLMRKGKY
ncbi:MAG: hypothetical protein J6Y37_13450 [Paludibacteraceae bacterium]|nr:hypothetical protein [Paludibacteraceae bacterium]